MSFIEYIAEQVAVPVNYVSLWLQQQDSAFWSDVLATLQAQGLI